MPETPNGAGLAVEKVAEEAKEEIKLPELPNGATSFYDTETKVYWFGVPVATTDPDSYDFLTAKFKYELVSYLKKLIREQQSRIAKPTGWQRAKDAFAGLIH